MRMCHMSRMYLISATLLIGFYSSVNGGISVPLPPPSICVAPQPVSTDLFGDLFNSSDSSDEIDRALAADTKTTTAVLTDKALNEMMNVQIPVFFRTKSMCKYKYVSWSPGRFIWWNNRYCDVLRHYWYQSWNYVYCPNQFCSNVPCNRYTRYVYRCRPSCYRTFAFWIYCKVPGVHSYFHRIVKRLPQCCQCYRFRC